MADRNRTNTTRLSDGLINSPSAALQTSSQLRSSSASKFNKDQTSDDVIGMLANAYENRRAQQVSEWERAQTYKVYAV